MLVSKYGSLSFGFRNTDDGYFFSESDTFRQRWPVQLLAWGFLYVFTVLIALKRTVHETDRRMDGWTAASLDAPNLHGRRTLSVVCHATLRSLLVSAENCELCRFLLEHLPRDCLSVEAFVFTCSQAVHAELRLTRHTRIRFTENLSGYKH